MDDLDNLDFDVQCDFAKHTTEEECNRKAKYTISLECGCEDSDRIKNIITCEKCLAFLAQEFWDKEEGLECTYCGDFIAFKDMKVSELA